MQVRLLGRGGAAVELIGFTTHPDHLIVVAVRRAFAEGVAVECGLPNLPPRDR